ncbi:DUF1996 domain-containing protein [Aspergillus mulundensis]|uniref:DUF1996 domain-containing protein n=1 Tax=Aspergillus mulundensis TaxID=1810919 RepID=A0A3D8SK02_9EURO|nr:Uncharacterized protein DSM5745_03275 [Aspergillus mulundensis]RDW86633.1 Uncharacterized protein DSM5745_03275 [Aspergillus mulundensis]
MRSLLSILAGASLAAAWTELSHAPFMNKNIDAIVQPGAYTSHMHTFFGSDAITNVLPTSADLQTGCYTGDNPNDLSVYCASFTPPTLSTQLSHSQLTSATGVPTLYHVDGDTYTEVPIFKFSTYYTNAFATSPIPQDFAMLSGNASATTQAEADNPYNNMEWFCEGSDARESNVAQMPSSTCDQHLQVNLVFPQCVNPDDHSDYDFADDSQACPEGMVSIPQLRYRVLYDTRSVAPSGWSGAAPFLLSCSDTLGAGYCFHGDFVNGWYEDAAENMLANGGGGYTDGQFVAGSHGDSAVEATCTAADQDPGNGTSDYLASLEMMAGGAAGDETPTPTAALSTPAATVPAMTTTTTTTTPKPSATQAPDSRRRQKHRTGMQLGQQGKRSIGRESKARL